MPRVLGPAPPRANPTPPAPFPAAMRATLVLGLVLGANAGAVELTSDNFKELVTESGKVRARTRFGAAAVALTLHGPCRHRVPSSSSSRLGEGTASR